MAIFRENWHICLALIPRSLQFWCIGRWWTGFMHIQRWRHTSNVFPIDWVWPLWEQKYLKMMDPSHCRVHGFRRTDLGAHWIVRDFNDHGLRKSRSKSDVFTYFFWYTPPWINACRSCRFVDPGQSEQKAQLVWYSHVTQWLKRRYVSYSWKY